MAIQSSAPAFVPIVSEAAPPKKMQRVTPAAAVIVVELSDALVRIAPCADDGALLTAVLRAVRASAIFAWSAFPQVFACCWPRVRWSSAEVRTDWPRWQQRCWLNPFSGAVIVYRAKRADRVKLLLWDGSGLV